MAITVTNDELIDGHKRTDGRKGLRLPVEQVVSALKGNGYSAYTAEEQAYNRDETQREGNGYAMLVMVKANCLPFGLVYAHDAQSSIKGFLGTLISGEFFPLVQVFNVHNRLAHFEKFAATVEYLPELIQSATDKVKTLAESFAISSIDANQAEKIIEQMVKSIGGKLGSRAINNIQVNNNMLENKLTLLKGLLPQVAPFQWIRWRVRYSLELIKLLSE